VILNMLAAAQEAGTAREAVEYAAREAAAAPGLEHFAGGDTIVVSGLLVVVIVVVLVWLILN